MGSYGTNPQRAANIERELARLDGKPPYDGPENITRNDAYYAADIERRYGRKIAELRKEIQNK